MGAFRKFFEKLIGKKFPLEPGIYHQRKRDESGNFRLHLRVNPGGEGILMINAARILYLNQTATEMAKYIIDDLPDEKIVSIMAKRYRVRKKVLRRDLNKIRETISTISRGEKCCPISFLGVERTEPFSVEVNAPYRMDIALTYGCENRCPHCYNESQRKIETLSKDDFKRVISKLWDTGIPHICFTGGEPTAYPDLVELIEYAEELGIITGLLTNGRRLKDPDFMNELSNAGLDHVQITIHSHISEVHDEIAGASGAFADTVQGIKNAVLSPVYTVTNTTITKKNAGGIEGLVPFLDSLGVRHIAANCLIKSGSAKSINFGIPEKELEPILVRLSETCNKRGITFTWYSPTRYCEFNPLSLDLGAKQCTAAKYNMCIEPNGDVLPCQSYYKPLGNILRDDWGKIFNNEEAIKLRNHLYAPDECKKCSDFALCGGGCPLSLCKDEEHVFACPDSASNPA